MLTETAAAILSRVEREAGLPVAWLSHDDEGSPVRCRPTKRFGRPSIGGVSTEAIVERLDGREDEDDDEAEDEIAEQFGLSVDDVRWASAFELSRRAA